MERVCGVYTVTDGSKNTALVVMEQLLKKTGRRLNFSKIQIGSTFFREHNNLKIMARQVYAVIGDTNQRKILVFRKKEYAYFSLITIVLVVIPYPNLSITPKVNT